MNDRDSSGAVGSESERDRSIWTLGEMLSWTEDKLLKLGIDSPRTDAQHLLAHALGCSRIELYVGLNRQITDDERATYRELVRRRLNREPVAYIEGTRGFHALDLDLLVDKRVLIPRPETEHLVDWVLETLRPRKHGSESVEEDFDHDATAQSSTQNDNEEDVAGVAKDEPGPGPAVEAVQKASTQEAVELTYVAFENEHGQAYELRGDISPTENTGAVPTPDVVGNPRDGQGSQLATEPTSELSDPHAADATVLHPAVLDVGTGSGAIALAVKKAMPQLRVMAVDISPDALEVAEANAKRAELDIVFRRSDLIAQVPKPRGGWTILTANLPYIPSADCDELQPEVRDHEPRLALDGGADGLDLVRTLVKQACEPSIWAAQGWIFLEIGIHQAPDVEEILRKAGFTEVESKADYGGIDRVVSGRAPTGQISRG